MLLTFAMLFITKVLYLHHNFKYPFWLTGTHMMASLGLAALVVHVIDREENLLAWKDRVEIVAPFSVLGALAIVFGNAALMFLYPALSNALMDSSQPLGCVLCGYLLSGTRYTRETYLTLIPISLAWAGMI